MELYNHFPAEVCDKIIKYTIKPTFTRETKISDFEIKQGSRREKPHVSFWIIVTKQSPNNIREIKKYVKLMPRDCRLIDHVLKTGERYIDSYFYNDTFEYKINVARDIFIFTTISSNNDCTYIKKQSYEIKLTPEQKKMIEDVGSWS